MRIIINISASCNDMSNVISLLQIFAYLLIILQQISVANGFGTSLHVAEERRIDDVGDSEPIPTALPQRQNNNIGGDDDMDVETSLDSNHEDASDGGHNGSSNATAEELKTTATVAVRPRSRCFTGALEGACYTGEECFRRGGVSTLHSCGMHYVCCTFLHTCGDVTSERVSYFRSPDYPSKSIGSLACDYDVIVQATTCAIRFDYEKVSLARKLGGVCDIDQLFILNSIDGPTAGQCGPLSGYSTTVAVTPGQTKPVKVAALVQNEGTYHWDIKVTQLACNNVNHFRPPAVCGLVRNDVTAGSSSFTKTYTWFKETTTIKKQHQTTPAVISVINGPKITTVKKKHKHTWWNYPEPIFNTYYFGSTKRHMQQHALNPSASINGRRRVVSGSDASLGEFPWVVAIGLDQMFFCGGALINDKFVLTAAHCVMARDTPIGSLVLHLGDLDLTVQNETRHVLRGVRKILFHSHFHPFLLANDIALLQLDEPVHFSDTIQPVCLPQPGESYTGQKASVVGWGVTSFPMGEPSPTLQKLEVETLSNFQCSRVIEEPVTLGMICAAPTSLQGTCFGDSGGPLTYQSKEGHYTLIGVVSFGVTGCAVMPAFPDLYTRVSEYIKWIHVNAM